MSVRTLHARFLRAVLAVSALLLLAASAIVFEVARERYVQAGQASVRAMVSAIDKTLAIAVYAQDPVLQQELLDGLARHPTVRSLEVRDLAGVRLHSATGHPMAAEAASGIGASGAVPDVTVPLHSPFDAQESVGLLALWFDNERLAQEAGRQATLLVAALSVTIVAALAVFNMLARRLLSRPMHRLAQELAGITPGSNRRVDIDARHAHDEVGIVATAANQLLELQEQALAREREMREAIAAMEARYRGLFDSSSAGIFVLSLQGELQQGNPALWRLIGLEPGVPTSFARASFADPDRLEALIDHARLSMQPESADLELQHDDGRRAWVHCMLAVVEQPSTGQRQIEGVLYDINQRHERERAAQHRAEHDALTGLKSRSYFETLLDARVATAKMDEAAVTLLFIDLDGFKAVNDRWGHAAGDAVLIESAQRLRSIFRRRSDVVGRLGGDELVVLIEGAQADDPGVAALADHLIRRFAEPFGLPNGEQATLGASVGLASYPIHANSAETLIEAADAAMYAVKKAGKGGYLVAAPAVPGHAPACGAGAQPHDDDAQALLVDPLTGLADRRGLALRLKQAQAGIAPRGGFVAVVCVDIDQFKSINLAYGPEVGDEVLCESARRLRRALRPNDTLARTGSDEFVAVIPVDARDRGAAADIVRLVIDKLAGRLAESFDVGPHRLSVRFSMGMSLLAPQTEDAAQVLQEAQLALRLSKTHQGGGALFFEPDMMAGFLQQRSLEDDLRDAVASDQLRLYVQPQIDRAGGVCGGEALLRWQHPRRGLVLPGEFIPLAESSGLIVELGRWVLRRGCEILASMHHAGGERTLAINISPLQFNQPDFVADVREALTVSGAPADALILEITEGLLLSDLAQVSAKIRALAGLGIRFSIDDFGTGFSSLGYLRQLPLHEIKIDRSFISGLPDDPASAGIVRSILSMGRHLGLNVVAEGVETQAQADFLAAHDCGVQQGWLYGRPSPPEHFLDMLAADEHGPSPDEAGAPAAVPGRVAAVA